MNQPARILTSPERLRLCVADFELLADNGAFVDYGKTELIDGDIYVTKGHFTRHARTSTHLLVEFANRLAAIGSDLEALMSVSVHMSEHDMPAPDIVLTRFRGNRAEPVESVALVVEVADTTLETDLGRKAALYAAAGVPEYWVVDLNGNRVVMHERPGSDGYEQRSDVAVGETLVAITVERLEGEIGKLFD